MDTPIGSIYTTTAIKDFTELTGITPEQFILGIGDIALGNGTRLSFGNMIASIISSDSGNLLEVGTDSLLKSVGSSIDFDDLTDTEKVIFGNTEYGGTISANLDIITKSGFYTCYSAATGAPNSSYSWFVLHQNSNSGVASATQRAVAFNSTPIVYERVKTSSIWGPWILQAASSVGIIPQATCETAPTIAEKVVTVSSFVLATGATIQVTFTNANTATTPTLNVNSTGAKAIYNEAGTAVSATNPAYFPAGSTIEFTYDGTNWRFKKRVIENYINGTSWYRVYSNGWVEQGGILTRTSSPSSTLTLLKNFSNTNYTIQCCWSSAAPDNLQNSLSSSKTSTSTVTFYSVSGVSASFYINWVAYGY